MNTRLACSLLLSLTSACCLAESTDRQPNIIVVVADDHRYDVSGIVQRELGDDARFPFFESPHLDRLSREGVRFRNAFVVHSLCSPSRATVLTGLHTHEHGITFNEQPFVSKKTWPHLLAANGWTTAYFGKWHMGNQRERPGFQEVATFINQGTYSNCPFVVNGKSTPSQGWVDDVSTDYAIDFIRRSADKPFAMYLGFKSPHDNRTPSPRHEHTYSQAKLRKPDNWNVPPPWRKDAGWDWEQRHADRLNYFKCIAGIDDNIGRLLDVLDETNLAENTLIIYMGDNGYYLGEYGLGDKRTAYDASMRIPFLVRYPRVVAPAVRDELVLNLDVTATILDACSIEPTWRQHGMSLMPLLTHDPGTVPWRKSFLYQNYRDPAYPNVTFDVLAVRTDDYKYVKHPGHPEWTQLFDLRADPQENHNLIDEPRYANIRAQLLEELERLKNEVDYVKPVPGDLGN